MSPYLRITVATVESVVPSLVLERSQLFFQLLADQRPDSGTVAAASAELTSSLATYQVHSALVASRNTQAMSEVVNALKRDDITSEDKRFLLIVIGRVAQMHFADSDAATKWWDGEGHVGQIDARTLLWTKSSG